MDARVIYCPKCRRKVARWDGKSKINVIVNCKKCKKRIVYHVDKLETEIKNIPQRNLSSGKTFY